MRMPSAIAEKMPRTFTISLALLALAGCQPYGAPPPQGPYGTPESYPPGGAYPAPEPYQPQPYPAGPGGYPGQPYQPGQPNVPVQPDCPIMASTGWTAWINAMPGPNSRPTLVVSGKVITGTGYQVAFDQRLQVRHGQPPQAFVTLFVAAPAGGQASQVAVTHPLRWEWPLPQPVGSVVVSCGDKTLAEITNIQTAF
jgi:hypothetical protein